jgi:hypothetical protein
MSILESIQRSQALLAQLSSHPRCSADTQLQTWVKQLSAELESALSQVKQLEETAVETINPPRLDVKSGCYLFENEQGFFCPHCYDRRNQRVPTRRLNSRLRVCPACRSSIKPEP